MKSIVKSCELIGKKVVIAPFNTEAVFLYHRLRADGVEVIAFMDKDQSLHTKSYLRAIIIPYFHFEERNIAVVIANPGYIERDDVIYEQLIAAKYRPEEIFRQRELEFECAL